MKPFLVLALFVIPSTTWADRDEDGAIPHEVKGHGVLFQIRENKFLDLTLFGDPARQLRLFSPSTTGPLRCSRKLERVGTDDEFVTSCEITIDLEKGTGIRHTKSLNLSGELRDAWSVFGPKCARDPAKALYLVTLEGPTARAVLGLPSADEPPSKANRQLPESSHLTCTASDQADVCFMGIRADGATVDYVAELIACRGDK